MMGRNPGEIKATRKGPEALSLLKCDDTFEGMPEKTQGQICTGFSSKMVPDFWKEFIIHRIA